METLNNIELLTSFEYISWDAKLYCLSTVLRFPNMVVHFRNSKFSNKKWPLKMWRIFFWKFHENFKCFCLFILLTFLISNNTCCKTYFKHNFAKNYDDEKIDKFNDQNKFKFLLLWMQKNSNFQETNVFEIVDRQ